MRSVKIGMVTVRVLPELPRDVWLRIIQVNMKYHSECNEWIRHFQTCRARLGTGNEAVRRTI